jgi:hypothetical protein
MLLANNTRLKSGDTAIDRLLAVALQQPGLSPEDEACIHFAFGKIFDDRAQYDTAFHHYRRANELRRPQPPFDRGAWRQMVERIKRVFLNLELPRPTRPATGPRPGFVVGMLRSGTTLTERLLSSLPAVSSLGETELLDTFVQRLAEVKAESYPECVLQLDGNDIAAMTADYRRLISADAGSAAIVLDKNPLNFMHIGMIALLFPDAHIIHCRRHPLDTCLSVYFQNFAHARNNYAYDLEDIAAFYNGYSELMTFWEGLLPGRMITLGYEALITDPESVTRALYAEMNLDWAPEAIHPQSNPGTIATASLWQARQPIYSHSAGRWQNYAKHLDGLRASIEKITAFAPEHSATDTNL